MSVIFLGTSNCILGHSYVQTVKLALKECVVNASIGASPCTVGLYVFPDIEISEGDVAFLDYTITDEASLVSGVRPPDEIRRVFSTLIADLLKKGALPVLLVNPTKAALGGVTPIEDLHVALCVELGVPIFSVSALFRRALDHGCAIEALMMDPAHQSRAVTPVIGAAMVEAISAVRVLGPTARMVGTPVWDVRRIGAAGLVPPNRRRHRLSALRSANFAIVKVDESLVFDVGEDEAFLGFMLNAGAPGANIRLTGACEIVTSLMTSHDNRNPDAYMLQFVETRTRVQGGKMGIKLELQTEDAALSEYTLVLRSNDRDIYGELHIDGILVGKAGKAWLNADLPQRPMIDILEGRYNQLCTALNFAITSYEAQ